MASGRSSAAVPPQPCAIKIVGSFLPAEAFGAKTSADMRVPSLMMLARRKEMSSGGVKEAVCAKAVSEKMGRRIERQRMACDSITSARGGLRGRRRLESLPHNSGVEYLTMYCRSLAALSLLLGA